MAGEKSGRAPRGCVRVLRSQEARIRGLLLPGRSAPPMCPGSQEDAISFRKVIHIYCNFFFCFKSDINDNNKFGNLNRLEHGVYNLSRMRESGTKKFKNFQIPTDWMLDPGPGLVSQVIYLFIFGNQTYKNNIVCVGWIYIVWYRKL